MTEDLPLGFWIVTAVCWTPALTMIGIGMFLIHKEQRNDRRRQS